jgi:hypothetical protein
MDDLMCPQEQEQARFKSKAHFSSGSNFDEELRILNIKTMIEIYGEDFREKLFQEPQKNISIH